MKVVLYQATGRGVNTIERDNVDAVRGSHNTDKIILEYHDDNGNKVNEEELENINTYNITCN